MQKKVAMGIPGEWVRKYLAQAVMGQAITVPLVRFWIAIEGGPKVGDTAIRNNLAVLCDYEGKGQFRKRLPGG